MKFESLILASLSAACFALCVLVMGAMLLVTPGNVQLAGSQPPTTQPSTPVSCTPADDATQCPRA